MQKNADSASARSVGPLWVTHIKPTPSGSQCGLKPLKPTASRRKKRQKSHLMLKICLKHWEWKLQTTPQHSAPNKSLEQNFSYNSRISGKSFRYLCWSSSITRFSRSVLCRLALTSWSQYRPHCVASLGPGRKRRQQERFSLEAPSTSKWADVSNVRGGNTEETWRGRCFLKPEQGIRQGSSHTAGWSGVERRVVKFTAEGDYDIFLCVTTCEDERE